MKIDLHLHSKHSRRPSQWVLQKLGCPESYSDPLMLAQKTREMGMNGLTLTDHNMIEGCLEIAHLPGTFISEEVTTYFPEDRCKVHVLVWNINEALHEDIQKARDNIYDLVAYLNRHHVLHAVAHPLFSINDRLTLEHFERFLLLFKAFELNGARDEGQNEVIKALCGNLSPADVKELSDRYDYEPLFDEPWRKHLVAGSDDHSALNVARAYTEVPGAADIEAFLEGLAAGRSIPQGRGSTPRTLAHNLYGIAFQYFNSRFALDKFAGNDVLMRFLDRLLQPEPQSPGWIPLRLKGLLTQRRRHRLAESDKLQDIIRHVGEKTIVGDPGLLEIIRNGNHRHVDRDEQWFRFVDQVCSRVLRRFSRGLWDHLSGANVFNIFGSLGAAGSLYSLLAPYFVSYGLFGRDRALSYGVADRFNVNPYGIMPPRNDIKVAHFTDTYYEVNGVATTLRRQADLASRTGKDLTLITCARDHPLQVGRIRNFEPIDVFELPEYPEQKIFIPPFLQILRHIYEDEYTHLHAATPGPVGLTALAAARIMRLPISGTYHTAIPQYAAYLTGDDVIEQLVWRYTLWFYDQMETIYVPSRDTGRELISKGIAEEKILQYPRGVDTREFHPDRRNGYLQRKYQMNGVIKLLYVGRVSKEKNLHLLSDAFKRLCRERKDLHLIVVGDGPFLEHMKTDLEGWPCTFPGYIYGPELADMYASADLFVFPSTTDTFGNVILESQASGLPVIVTDTGGPCENIIPGETGLIVEGGSVGSLIKGIKTLADDPGLLARMSKAARAYMEERSFEKAFQEHWRLYSRDGTHPAGVTT